jgi:hypothetical protein
VHVLNVGRAPAGGHAWWSGGPLFDVKTGKVMVCAVAMSHPVGFMQSACSGDNSLSSLELSYHSLQ